jgi:hypothetical protein
LNPEQLLARDALAEGATTPKNQADFENRQLTILSEQLKQLIRQEAAVLLRKFGAAERIRTFDRLVNSQPLYRAEPRRQSIMLMPLWSFNIVFKF